MSPFILFREGLVPRTYVRTGIDNRPYHWPEIHGDAGKSTIRTIEVNMEKVHCWHTYMQRPMRQDRCKKDNFFNWFPNSTRPISDALPTGGSESNVIGRFHYNRPLFDILVHAPCLVPSYYSLSLFLAPILPQDLFHLSLCVAPFHFGIFSPFRFSLAPWFFSRVLFVDGPSS